MWWLIVAACGWMGPDDDAVGAHDPGAKAQELEDRAARRARRQAGAGAASGDEVKLAVKDQTNQALRKAAVAQKQDFPAHVIGPVERSGEDEAVEAEVDPLRMLETLGYVDGVVEARDDRPEGVTVQHPTPGSGWSFYTPAGQPLAILEDLRGEEVWRWQVGIRDVWPQFRGPEEVTWRRAVLLDGGDVVGLWSGYGLVRVGPDGAVRWGHFLPVHHDLQVMEDGSVITLTRRARIIPEISERPVLEDFVAYLGPDGALVREFSLLKAFQKYKHFDAIFEGTFHAKTGSDPFHTNSIEVLDDRLEGKGAAFKPGNLLVSMRHLAVFAVVDPVNEEVVWALRDDFRGQHDPRVTDDGTILLFDNRGLGTASRLIEYDPATREPVWAYRGTKKAPFYTVDCGHAQRLPNGHTLVNESANGRAFEIDRDGEIVWERWSSYRTGDGAVARYYEFRRVPPETDLSWAGL